MDRRQLLKTALVTPFIGLLPAPAIRLAQFIPTPITGVNVARAFEEHFGPWVVNKWTSDNIQLSHELAYDHAHGPSQYAS